MATLFLAAALYFPYFLHLDALPLRLWDESRLACNALDQYQNGFGVVVRFEGEVDLWNTKPPLMIWLQAACMKIFGPGELAVRLPAALAGWATSLLLFFKLKTPAGATAALILATMPGWVGYHGARTGDYDALLVFCCTGFLLFFFDYLRREKARALWTAAGFAATGLLVKGVAMVMCVPGAVLAASWIRPGVFRRPEPYFAALAALLPLLSFYLLRENAEPGYLKAVWNNEIGGRYFSTLEGHRYPWYYYIAGMLNGRWGYWAFVVGFAVWAVVSSHYRLDLAKYLWTTSLSYLIIVSGSQTKLEWYDLPVYPLFAALTALGWRMLFSKPIWILTTALVAPSYVYVVSKAYHPKERPWDERLYALPRLLKREAPPSDFIAVGEFRQLIAFYARKGRFPHRTLDDDFRPGEKILVSEDRAWERLNQRYDVRLLKDENGVRYAEILAGR